MSRLIIENLYQNVNECICQQYYYNDSLLTNSHQDKGTVNEQLETFTETLKANSSSEYFNR